jgi:hypothetical protein
MGAHAEGVFAGDMGIDQGGAQVGMAEQVLNGADVGASFKLAAP